MPNWSIHLEERTATFEIGICFMLTEIPPGVFDGVVINPETISPDDIDEIILSDLRREALEEFKNALDKG